jgi:hypothetical protein
VAAKETVVTAADTAKVTPGDGGSKKAIAAMATAMAVMVAGSKAFIKLEPKNTPTVRVNV